MFLILLAPLPKKFPNDLLHFSQNLGVSRNRKLKQGKTVKHKLNEDRLTRNFELGKAPENVNSCYCYIVFLFMLYVLLFYNTIILIIIII